MAPTLSANQEPELPTEIWLLVLEHLEPHDLRQCRLVNKTLRPLATPLFFNTFVFRFNRRSVENLTRLACDREIAKHVRTLVLWRGPELGLRGFGSFEEWEKCLALSNGDDVGDGGYPIGELSDDDNKYSPLMSKRDWSELTLTERDALYSDYNEERRERGLTPDVREQLVNKVKDALEQLVKLSEIIHDPVVLGKSSWSAGWKRLRFDHHQVLLPESAWEKEHDVDALHLACLLEALGRVERYPIDFQSFTFYVEGPAFWSPSRLHHLFRDCDHGKIRGLRRTLRDATQADLIADRDFNDMKLSDEVAQLASMKKIFHHLTHVDCYVSDEEENGSLSTTAQSLLAFLCSGHNLERISLVHGDFLDQDTESYDRLTNYHERRPSLLPALASQKPWPKVTRLKLSIATHSSTLLQFLDSLAPTLRHLVLEEVTLLPIEDEEATWEVVLPNIARNLQELLELELSCLQDFSSQGEDQVARKLFNPLVETWEGRQDCYDYYVHTVVSELLRTQELQRPVDPSAFMSQHDPLCEHVEEQRLDSFCII
ncbi:hypothetical protein DDE82_009156 [Stemphylium lycopersici]|uniref:F-box domain-containing protein n=1 Tax=Stemphylium lycopersici TaxID=183478 RepID=A0A364MRB5_STELY|nr:hypothetical protein TW65_09321 [Stemphylium lycopersici]RAQ93894.1 hypothetical protein DDE82_009156 [Stemphylium lycopersici]RAQ99710.1 hypothetical protein DDE83_009181 [Stemphylium lycopersici]